MKLKFIVDKKYDIEMAKAFDLPKEKIEFMLSCYKTSPKYLKESCTMYQKSWDRINNAFSKYIKDTTGYDWFYPKYECVMSFMHRGISNWGTAPKIVRIWDENPLTMRRITAHELILSHYFEIIKRHYPNENLTDGQIWALAEIAAFALTSLTDDVINFWPWSTIYYTNHNYSNIVDLQNAMRPIFLKRKSFDEYIQKGIKLVKKYPNMKS
jgi:hypothetical protein